MKLHTNQEETAIMAGTHVSITGIVAQVVEEIQCCMCFVSNPNLPRHFYQDVVTTLALISEEWFDHEKILAFLDEYIQGFESWADVKDFLIEYLPKCVIYQDIQPNSSFANEDYFFSPSGKHLKLI